MSRILRTPIHVKDEVEEVTRDPHWMKPKLKPGWKRPPVKRFKAGALFGKYTRGLRAKPGMGYRHPRETGRDAREGNVNQDISALAAARVIVSDFLKAGEVTRNESQVLTRYDQTYGAAQ